MLIYKLVYLLLISFLPVNAENEVDIYSQKVNKSFLLDKTLFTNYRDNYLNKSNNDYSEELNKFNIYSKSFSQYLTENQIDIVSQIPMTEEINSKDLGNNLRSNIEIESDIQYQIDDVFFAEGNVVMQSKGGILYADKISLNKSKKFFIAEGRVRIFRGDQYLESALLEYDYESKEGILQKVYGVMNLKSFNEDLNLKENIEVKEKDYLEKLKDLKLLDETLIILSGMNDGHRIKSPRLRFKLSRVAKWRFKAEKVEFSTSQFKSEEVFFTNDPYNKPQFILRSKDFSGEFIRDKLKLTSRSSFLIFDEKLTIPIGKRTIYDRDSISSWGIGSDYAEKDGVYVYRGFNSKKLFDKFFLKITPYFLIQRAYKGTTKNYVPKTKTLLSSKENDDTKFSDYLAADLEIEGKFADWQINLENNLSSFNFDRSHDLLRSNLLLRRNIFKNKSPETNNLDELNESKFSFSEEIDLEIFTSFRKNVWRGLNSQNEIYFGYGSRLISKNIWTEGKTSKNTYINLDLGSFKAKNLLGNEFINRERVTLSGIYGSRFQLWEPDGLDQQIDKSYRYAPNVIQQGLYFNNQIAIGLFEYSDGKSQRALELKLEPELLLGEKKKNFLDFFKLKAGYNYIISDGESPFSFDSINNSSYINLEFQQQLYGPLSFKYKSNIDLDYDSKDYGKFKDKSFEIFFNRRAYQISAYINDNDKVGLHLRINNFGYSGNKEPF